MPNFNITMGVN